MSKFRSKFEEQFNIDTCGTLEYEQYNLKYIIPESTHKYIPDWHIPGTNIFIEQKGRFLSKDRTKQILVKQQNPGVRIILYFQNPNVKLSKSSKTTYSMWCDKNGIEWMTRQEVESLIKIATLGTVLKGSYPKKS